MLGRLVYQGLTKEENTKQKLKFSLNWQITQTPNKAKQIKQSKGNQQVKYWQW